MKTIGLIGGMSWESTVAYYQIINETIKEKLGGLHSAKILLYSVDFTEIELYQSNGEWDKSGQVLGQIASKLEKAGCDFIVICTNTMHKVVPQIEQYIKIPIVHIADATADELISKNIKKVALLGTKYTMTENFLKEKIISHGIEVLIPNEDDIHIINEIIYKELCNGVIKQSSQQKYLNSIHKLHELGAEGVILGCTEIGLLIKQDVCEIPVFDTTQIHARKAVVLSLI